MNSAMKNVRQRDISKETLKEAKKCGNKQRMAKQNIEVHKKMRN
jgi:hypothetical protein